MTDRKIPSIMASQHPDNVFAPHWNATPYVTTYQETEECYRAFHDLGCDEYMWDWEGKLVDEAVIDRLYRKYLTFFKKKQLGRDVFLTYRIPNVSHEPGYRVGRAYAGLLSAAEFAMELGLHAPPIFELILPMTEHVDDLMRVQKTFNQTAKFQAEVFKHKVHLDRVNVIPLFEGVSNFLTAGDLLSEYIDQYKAYYGKRPEYMRPFIARSDPALNSGIVPTTLGIKVALSRFKEVAAKQKVELHPIIGPGGLPFRGHLHPQNVEHFVNEFRGIRTAIIQSSFRFDWPEEEVIKAIKYLKRQLPKGDAESIGKKEVAQIEQVITIFEKYYRGTIEKIADLINDIAAHVPPRRERMLHIGLLGYSRKVGKKKMPRAISFTASLYSLGLPPELIGLGRALEEVKKAGLLDVVYRYYKNFEHDVKTAGYFLNKENLEFLIADGAVPASMRKDIALAEEIMGIELGPRSLEHFVHRNSTSNVYFLHQEDRARDKEIEWAAKWRKSLG